MAKSKATSNDPSQAPDTESETSKIEDAVVLEETEEGASSDEGVEVTSSEEEETASEDTDAAPDEADDGETPEADADEEGSDEDDLSDDTSELEEPADEVMAAEESVEPAPAAAAPEPKTTTIVQNKVPVVPLAICVVLGGILGFVASRYFEPLPDAALTARVAELESQLSEVAGTANAAASQASVDEQATAMADMSAQVADFSTRLQVVEDQPPVSLGTEDLRAAYEAEIAALRSQFDSLAGGAEERLRMAEEAAALTEAEAAAMAAAAEADAALSQVFAAIDSGNPFSNALGAALAPQGLSAPDALNAVAADGVATLGDLKDTFPAAARSALAASRAALGEDQGVGGFLMTQLGVRSLEPQDGTSSDAILSRVEAALAEARLTDALAEIDTLPPEGQAALGDWLTQATNRAAALEAAFALRAEITGKG